jgi:hypothetical protein
VRYGYWIVLERKLYLKNAREYNKRERKREYERRERNFQKLIANYKEVPYRYPYFMEMVYDDLINDYRARKVVTDYKEELVDGEDSSDQ